MAFFGTCDGYCAPTVIYIILVSISILVQFYVSFIQVTPEMQRLTPGQRLQSLLSMIVSSAIFAFVLYIICSHCHSGISWFLLLFPLIIFILILLLLIASVDKMHL
jgi:ABC-type Na+ efflux pump permease subunit